MYIQRSKRFGTAEGPFPKRLAYDHTEILYDEVDLKYDAKMVDQELSSAYRVSTGFHVPVRNGYCYHGTGCF